MKEGLMEFNKNLFDDSIMTGATAIASSGICFEEKKKKKKNEYKKQKSEIKALANQRDSYLNPKQ